MSELFMLDTNMVSHAVRGRLNFSSRMLEIPVESLCISTITLGEIRFGLANKPDARRLHVIMGEFVDRMEIMPWDSDAAERYGDLRALLQRLGKSLDKLDMLIGAHALALGATLVTNDAAFGQIPDLTIEDWTQAVQ